MNTLRSFLFITLAVLLLVSCSEPPPPTPEPPPLIPETGTAPVESIEILKLASTPPQVRVVARGQMPDGCSSLGEARVEQAGSKFSVNISMQRQPADGCPQTSAAFEKIVALPVDALQPGSYTVTVNGVSAAFELEGTPAAQAAQPTPTLQASNPNPPPDNSPTETGEVDPAPTQAAPGPALVAGQVWLEECAPGSDCNGDGTRQPGEPGLAGVLVALAQEDCPGKLLTTTITEADGSYSFSGLEPGDYCLWVEAGNDHNLGILASGEWTLPPRPDGSQDVALAAGQALQAVDFGWQKVDQAAAEAETCTNRGAFFDDITIPDNSVIENEASFEKIWRIRNEGTCTWSNEYNLVYTSGDRMGGPLTSALPHAVAPGELVDISVALTAPDQAGRYIGNWQLRTPQGDIFGVGTLGQDLIWVTIIVGAPPASSGGSGAGGGNTPPTCGAARDFGYEAEVLALVNAERAAAGLTPLALQNQLSAAAAVHSADMACSDFVGHVGSDGTNWSTRIAAQGYAYTRAGENIYVGNPAYGGTPQGAVTWWMNSQVHRDNILSTRVTEIGVGYVYAPESAYGGYYTLVFADR